MFKKLRWVTFSEWQSVGLQLLHALDSTHRRLDSLIERVQLDSLGRTNRAEAVLACITILCKTPGTSDGRSAEGFVSTTIGGEAFIAPGEKKTIEFPSSQRMLGHLTYFISGHPNLVITSFEVAREEKKSNWAGIKYGECDAIVEIGQSIRVRVEYRVEGQSL